MSLWVLDTDMLTLWLRGQETVAARVATTPPQRLSRLWIAACLAYIWILY